MSAAAINACWKKIGIWGDGSCPELAAHTHCRNCATFGEAAATLLNRKPPEGYREEWTARVAVPRRPKPAGTKSAVIFRIGGEWLALPTALFLEVAGMRPIHSLPHRRNEVVTGLVAIRGELLVCVSLPHLLGFGFDAAPPARDLAPPRLLVVSRQNERVVFPVDEVHGNHRYHPDELTPAPATVSLATSAYSLGLLPWNHHHVGILDEELLFFTLGRSLA